MGNEEKITLNNGDSVVERIEKENFTGEFAKMVPIVSEYSEVTITDESIKNNAEFISNLFEIPK